MKKLFVILYMFVAINAIATDYVIVRNYEQTTIYELSTTASGIVYMNVYSLRDISINNLKQIGLPIQFWSYLIMENGVYDTRLIECQQQLKAANIQLTRDSIDIKNTETAVEVYANLFIASIVIISVILLVLYIKRKRR